MSDPGSITPLLAQAGCDSPAPGVFSGIVHQRRSIRAFGPRRVPEALLRQLVTLARMAPSAANLQPGEIIHVREEMREKLSQDLVAAWRRGDGKAEDYGYFPVPMPMHLRKRQAASAKALYGALGISREDRTGRDAHFERNFRFFDAPVGLVVTIDRQFGSGGFMDLGMMLYGLMLAAQAHGLATCAIGAMASFPDLIRRHLGLDERSHVVCGFALGYADLSADVNDTRTDRCVPDAFFRSVG